MSDKLLRTILNLLVVVAKEDDITSTERKSIEDFLRENVSNEEIHHYLKLFDKLVNEYKSESQHDETKSIIKQAYSVNKELTQEQKLVVMLHLLELIIADEHISDRERDLLYLIGTSFNFTEEIVDDLKSYVLAKEKEDFHSHSVLIVDSKEEAENKDTKHFKVKKLSGYLAFFHMDGIDMYFVKYCGEQALMLNGQALSRGMTKIFSNGSSIRSTGTKSSSPIYFSDIIAAFREEFIETNLSFVADDVTFKFPNGNIGLRKFNLAEEKGKLIGIMGGSGSGKSTLLNVLNGNEEPTTGSVRINGIDIHQSSRDVRGIIGYVPQDDLLIEELTVYQNLFYAAKLCFNNKSEDELEKLVEKLLSSLGLKETRDLKVGNPLQKTISGGQRKRLNIGLELLREPSVLFVDEPTSGLSSRDSENIMDLLKELSLKGKMIFVVIHQPSSDIFKMFDKLVILDVGGFQIYYGDPIDAVTYFKHIFDLIDKDQGACLQCGNVNPEQIFNIIETRVVDEYGRFTDRRKVSAKKWAEYFEKGVDLEGIREETEKPVNILSVPNKLQQLGVFIKRDFLTKISNKQYLLINLLEAPVLAVLLAFIIRYSPVGEDYTFRENINIPAFFFMSVIVALFMGLTVSAEEIIKDRLILKRESFLHLSRLSYLYSKLIILFGMSAIQTLMFVLISTWILEIYGITWSFWLILFSTSCLANVMGLNISSAFNKVVTVYILIPLLIIPQLILSGVVVNFDKLNGQITSEDEVPLIGEIMATRWAYEAITVSQFKNNPFTKRFYEFDRDIVQSEYKSVYLIPRLLENLRYCRENWQNSEKRDIVEYRVRLLKNEIDIELDLIGRDKFPEFKNLIFENLDTDILDKTEAFLNNLKKAYNKVRNKAWNAKEDVIEEINENPEMKAKFIDNRNKYENSRLIHLLKNTAVEKRIVEENGRLVRKVYPIYARETHPDHPLDFRTNFYYPEKHIFGAYISTPVFNVLVLWFITLVLFIALYYDWLRKLVTGRRRVKK